MNWMHKTGSLLKKRLRRVRPAQMVALSFALLILLGATLLTLPISSAAHTPTGFLTCLFTATSATCVTGLIVVDTGLYWSTFGKVVIIVLIQIGGLGFMTLVSVFFVMLGKRIGLRQRMLLAQVLCQEPDVLLLDEPGNHLDLRFQQELFLLIDAWRREPGHAVVSVVHDLSLARKFGTHALLLSSGRGTYGEISAILTPAALESAWQMDVVGWLRSLGDVWQE